MFIGTHHAAFTGSRISPASIEAYLTTEYRVIEPSRFVLLIGRRHYGLATLLASHENRQCAAVPTAWNPFSKRQHKCPKTNSRKKPLYANLRPGSSLTFLATVSILWANGLLRKDAGEAATELLKTITPAKIESWTSSDPIDWANESFAIAEQAQTKYCIRQGASCDRPSGKVKIDAAYVAANAPIIRDQLQKAGVRLAHLLDAALGK